MDTISISVEPQNALVDDRIEITINGLRQFQPVTVHLKCTESNIKFASCGCFKASSEGRVNISQDECLDGTYKGQDSMGLFWSAKAEPGFEYKRFLKNDVCTPLLSTFKVYDGFFTWEDLYKRNLKPIILGSIEIRRWYKSPDVQRMEVHEGKIRGALFIPKGEGPFPAVVDLFGGRPGLVDYRASLLACRGFLVQALAYYMYKDLPRDVYMEYFQEASTWLAAHPLTCQGRIGVVGSSIAGNFACAMATYIKEVVAAVLINTTPYGAALVVEDESFPAKTVERFTRFDRALETDEGQVMKYCFEHNEKYLTPSWESKSRFLCLVSADDQCTDTYHMEYWYSKWPPDQRHKIEMIIYQDAGHLLDPPYSPHQRVTARRFPSSGLSVWGGRPEGHIKAQEDSWNRVLRFLRQNVQKQMEKGPKSLL